MSILPVGFGSSGGIDTGDIGHSLRFRSSASAYLSRTFGAGNQQKMTLHLGVKRGDLTADNTLLSYYINANNFGLFRFSASTNTIRLYLYAAGALVCQLDTAQVERDPIGHLFVTLGIDTTQATAANRVKLEVNGSLVTGFSVATYPAQNATLQLNSAIAHNIGRSANGSQYFDGYLSRICWVGDEQLSSSSFIYLNTEINEWVSKSQSTIKAVVDAGGTNSFMLDFDNGTSLTTLGYDKSSKGNNWTLSNFSLTAGTTYDWMLDVPGNSYATLNPLDPTVTINGNTLSEGNLKLVTSAGNYNGGHATQATVSGKVYFEATLIAYGTGMIIGMDFGNSTAGVSYPGSTSGSYAYRGDGQKGNNGSWSAYGTATVNNDVIGVAYDADAGKLYFSKNGTWQNSGDPVAGTGFAFSGLSGVAFPHLGDVSGSLAATFNVNFGQAPLHASATYHSAAGGYFCYTPPTGFKALCQANIPEGETITVSGSFTGTLNANGPYVDIKGTPTAMTINGNAVTFGTHADKTAFGFKLRTASSSYNNTGSNTFSVSSTGPKRKYALAKGNP